jgi:hypothetical protein
MGALLRLSAIWFSLSVPAIVVGAVLGLESRPAPDDPLGPSGALLIVNALTAGIVFAVARTATARGWRLAVLVGGLVLSGQTLLMQMEALYFIQQMKMPFRTLAAVAATNTASAAGAGLAALLLFRDAPSAGDPGRLSKAGWVGAVVLYVLVYFVAGFLVAWSFPAVRAYYGDAANLDLGPLAAFQVLRGALWAALVAWAASQLRGGRIPRALLVGTALAVLTGAQLLGPNEAMPWAVRGAHLLELASSMFVYGALATLMMVRRPRETLAAQAVQPPH